VDEEIQYLNFRNERCPCRICVEQHQG
jgi:hypothetical protein